MKYITSNQAMDIHLHDMPAARLFFEAFQIALFPFQWKSDHSQSFQFNRVLKKVVFLLFVEAVSNYHQWGIGVPTSFSEGNDWYDKRSRLYQALSKECKKGWWFMCLYLYYMNLNFTHACSVECGQETYDETTGHERILFERYIRTLKK